MQSVSGCWRKIGDCKPWPLTLARYEIIIVRLALLVTFNERLDDIFLGLFQHDLFKHSVVDVGRVKVVKIEAHFLKD